MGSKDEPDLADIGGETSAAAHDASIAPPDRKAQATGPSEAAVRCSTRIKEEHNGSELEAYDDRG